MKLRFEHGELLGDFNYRGWNPELITKDLSDEEYSLILDIIEEFDLEVEDMDITDMFTVMMEFSKRSKS